MQRLLLSAVVIFVLALPCFAAAADKSDGVKKADIDQLLKQTRAALAARSGEEVTWKVISAGGRKLISENYELQATIGQTAVGNSSSDSYGLSRGYWQDFGGGGCCQGATRGNVDYDGGDNIDISDLVYLVDYMFTNGPAPPCFEEADMNGDTALDISDLVWLVDYMFTNGPPPVACP